MAVLNYPLMNPDRDTSNLWDYFRLWEETRETKRVPLYIHIPFCIHICNFCIYSRELIGKNANLIDQYTESLVQELKMYGNTTYVKSSLIGAIFFGGGTPTCLTENNFERIINTCREYLPLADDVEITVECNILNTNAGKLRKLKELGVSRISTGVQTLDDKYRGLLGLKTTSEQVMDWVTMAKQTGFQVVSLDMMYSLPGQSRKEWDIDIRRALELNTEHLSVYELCILSGSVLYNNIVKKGLPAIGTEKTAFQMYSETDDLLKSKGYQHHIIPEYNRAGKRAEFWELSYKGYGDNLSAGASSFGFLNGISYQNISDITRYMETVKNGGLPIGLVSDSATEIQMKERAIVLGLRRRYVEKDKYQKRFGCGIRETFPDLIDDLTAKDLLVERENCYCLTPQGEFMQGDISTMFMNSTFEKISPLKKRLALGNHIIPDSV